MGIHPTEEPCRRCGSCPMSQSPCLSPGLWQQPLGCPVYPIDVSPLLPLCHGNGCWGVGQWGCPPALIPLLPPVPPGIYVCAKCGHELFSSRAKYEHSSPWPAFTETLRGDSVAKRKERPGALKVTRLKRLGIRRKKHNPTGFFVMSL